MNFLSYKSVKELMRTLVKDVKLDLEQAIKHKNTATFVVPGGTTPGPLFDLLSTTDIEWNKVTVFSTDERWVETDSPRSNFGLIKRRLLKGQAGNANLLALFQKNKNLIDQNIKVQKFKIVDARSKERFEGNVAEPRKGLRSGSIKNSYCLPFTELINEDGTFADKDKILEKFKTIKCDLKNNLVFTCGSGVTASVLALAYSLIDNKYMPTIYDGSWSEYGKF